jgi:hypothetical protein
MLVRIDEETDLAIRPIVANQQVDEVQGSTGHGAGLRVASAQR